ncbi:hypothetical protein [Gemmata sp.]|uniref:hypothetical protein n=1 Tax=Gemmata sp. TaxID=1914242 RepID=UPI003F70491D
MTTTDLKAVVTQCETVAAVARLAETIRPAESATIRRPASDTLGMSPYREVAISFPTEVAAREFLTAIEAAGKKLS